MIKLGQSLLTATLLVTGAASALAAVPSNWQDCQHMGESANASIQSVNLQDVVRTKDNTTVKSSNGNCVRTKWLNSYDACNPVIAETKVRAALTQEERALYFDFNKTTLTEEGKRKLDSLITVIHSDANVKQARVIGFADRIGTPGYNEQLSRKRAEAVRNYLIARGIVTAEATETRWFGESVPATSCADTLKRPELIACLQKDRRVEVEIDYQPELRADRQ
jgi:outer membrane protein OmpA-like peptidoglycan-associated protein